MIVELIRPFLLIWKRKSIHKTLRRSMGQKVVIWARKKTFWLVIFLIFQPCSQINNCLSNSFLVVATLKQRWINEKNGCNKKNQAKISNFWPIDLIGLEKISVDLIFFLWVLFKKSWINLYIICHSPTQPQWVVVRTIATYYSTSAILPTFQIPNLSSVKNFSVVKFSYFRNSSYKGFVFPCRSSLTWGKW